MADADANITQIQRGFNFLSIKIELHQFDQITIKYIKIPRVAMLIYQM